MLAVLYRPSPPSTDPTSLAQTDLEEELSNQDICTSVHNRFRGKSLPDVNAYTCTVLLQLLLWRTWPGFLLSSESPPKHAFPSNEMNTSYGLKNMQQPFPRKTSLRHSKPLTGQQAECFPWATSPPLPLLMTSPGISMQHTSLGNPHHGPNRGSVACRDDGARDRRPLMRIQKVIIKAHQELQFISGFRNAA